MRSEADGFAVCRCLRLRPCADAQLPPTHHGLVSPRPKPGHTANAAPLLFAGPVRAQSGPVPRPSRMRMSCFTAWYRTATTSGTRRSSAARARCCAAARWTRSAAIAVETVTEDAHTSLRLQIRGWNTAYINIPQAAGLATERLSGHMRQRVRWARGMVQILRIENPLFAPGLKPAQRLCYFNAMTHFLYALPRLIFLTAPLIYLMLGRPTSPATG